MTDIGDLVVRIQADASQLQSGMTAATSTVKQSADQMTSALNGVKSVIGTFGIALSAGALVEFSKGALDAADNLYIMSQRTGIAASTLSALNIPLKQNGSSVDEFASSMKFLSRNIELASEGNTELLQRFSDLGLSVTKLKALSPEDQMLAWAAALGQVSDHGKLMADAIATGGRGVAGIIPLIIQMNGQLGEFVQHAKDVGNALTDDEIKKVHDYEDAWVSLVEHAKIGVVDLTVAIHDLAASSPLGTIGAMGDILSMGSSMQKQAPVDAYMKKLQTGGFTGVQFKNQADTSAKGSNSDIAASGGAGGAPTKDAASQIDDYVQKLQDEADALSKSKLALEDYNAEQQLSTQLGRDLTDEEKMRVDVAVDALATQKDAQDKLTESQKKATEMAAQMDAQISAALADIVINYKNAGTTILNVLDQIAKKLIEQNITTPLVNGLSGLGTGYLGALFGAAPGSNETISPALAAADPSLTNDVSSSASSGGLFSGIASFLGFASGGSPPVGVPSVVGENGPELFVPSQAGTIIPNNKLGGSNVVVQQMINLSPGLAETVNAAIINAAPSIAGMAHAGVMAAIQKGGAESTIVGRRNS